MLTYLYRNSQGQNPADVQAFITAGDLIRESLVPPAALAAVFRAVARIPGVTVARHATNAAGQHGVGVQQTYHGISEQLIFNPRTFAFIGERQVVVAAGAGLPIGTVMDSTAILAAGVTGPAGSAAQLTPDGLKTSSGAGLTTPGESGARHCGRRTPEAVDGHESAKPLVPCRPSPGRHVLYSVLCRLSSPR